MEKLNTSGPAHCLRSAARKPHYQIAVAALIFAAAVCFSHIHQGSLKVDGIRYAHIAQHINLSGEWLALYDEFKDAAYNNKPPLLFWLVAVSVKIFGFSTFAVKLPAALFVFGGLLVLWDLVARFYGYRAAFFALILFCANRVFVRSIVDLNFEGMILCGALLCLRTCLIAIRSLRLGRVDYLLFGLGMFLLLQSKPPYVAFVAAPLAILYLRAAEMRALIRGLVFSKIVVIFCLLGLSWVLASSQSGMERMISNQVSQPLTIDRGYLFNLSRWARAVFLELAPLTWFGLAAVVAGSRRREFFFLLAWMLPAIGIIFIVDHQSRYLIVPFLPLTILAAPFAARLCRRLRCRHMALGCMGFSAACFTIFLGMNVRAHEEHGAVALLRRHAGLVDSSTPVCINGADNLSSKPGRKRVSMLLELEFERRFPVAMYQTIGSVNLQPSAQFIAEDNCIEQLKKFDISLAVLDSQGDFSLVRLETPLPDVTRSGADDSAFYDYH